VLFIVFQDKDFLLYLDNNNASISLF